MYGIPNTVRMDLPSFLGGYTAKTNLESALAPAAKELAVKMAEKLSDKMRSEQRMY
jgi:hypothetical protein